MRTSPAIRMNSGNDFKVVETQSLAHLYQRLLEPDVKIETVHEAEAWMKKHIGGLDLSSCDLPDNPQDLQRWTHSSAQSIARQYASYLEQRKTGDPRRYFNNRAHALYFLKAIAPTKLVDGAWLYGLVKHWRVSKFSGLARTYIEELGDGFADRNHVVIYKSLLSRYGLDLPGEIKDNFYTQGLVQLVLAHSANSHLPEVIGFNLGYEQLPLHLLITAYELNELGIDPYYFTLHVTIDNSDTGHALRAVNAVLDNLPRMGHTEDFWRRVKVGYQLSNLGLNTQNIIADFDIDEEIIRIFKQKSSVGLNAHSDYCRVAGRYVNDWLSSKENIPEFLHALQMTNWIIRGEPAVKSRFWNLLQGDRAAMFGVFTSYELQVIHDWIRGTDSSDGQTYEERDRPPSFASSQNFRITSKLAATRCLTSPSADFQAKGEELLDADLQMLIEQLLFLEKADQETILLAAMSPAHHWTPAGLFATRLFNEMIR